MKRPSFQWYPGDWLRDTALRSCSVGARGLWIDMICLMHEGTPYGYLKVNHKVILPPNLARMVGSTLQETEGWLDELRNAGVFSEGGDGIFSRRMIRDEQIRVSRASGGIKGGNPALLKNGKVNGKVNHAPNLEITPSSSSSSAIIPHNPPPNPASPSGNGRKAKDNLPTSQEAKCIAGMFHRVISKPWSDKEVKVFRSLQPFDHSELMMVEDYYAANWPPKTGVNILRHDLQTFLNNYRGEIDRARNFFAKANEPKAQGEFAKPFHAGPEKPQWVIDRENSTPPLQ